MGGFSCTSCGRTYDSTNGVPCFTAHDTFYEEHGFTSTGRTFSSTLTGKLGLYFARGHFLYDVSKACPEGGAVIELGCGGGSAHLGSRYEMLGVDLSSSSASAVAAVYGSVVQASSDKLPIADGSADAVISSYFMEHLDDEVARNTLNEIHRVLKPSGHSIHCLDIDPEGSFHDWARRQPWYEDIFIQARGHFGLRSLAAWRALMTDAGFEIQAARAFCKTWLQDASTWAELDNDAVRGIPRKIGSAAARVRARTGWLPDVITTLVDDSVGRLMSDRRGSKVILTVRKQK